MNIYYILVNLFNNTNTGEPVRLQKQASKEDICKELYDLIARNFDFIALVVVLICIIVFIYACFSLTGVSAVESGNYYNHLTGVI